MHNINVAIVKCNDYQYDRVFEAVIKAIELANDFPDVHNKTVLIKPNMLYPVSPDKAVTTHPALLYALISFLKGKNPKTIIVGDSPGVASMDLAGKKTGLKAVTLELGAQWIEFDNPTLLENHEGKIQKQFYPAKIVTECDVLITIPKLKTHEMMYYTGAMKNLFGTIPGLNKSRFHFNFPEKDDFATMIVDLNIALKADYALMDGIVAMEGPGPGSGYPKQLGIILASSNLLALDVTASEIIGYNPLEIPILRIALENGFWLKNINEINHCGEDPKNVKPEGFKRVKVLKDTGFIKKIMPKAIYRIIKDLYVPRPFFSKSKCISCGKCIDICPAEALQFNKKKKIDVDYEKCIRCYCCHEVCPADAIRVGKI